MLSDYLKEILPDTIGKGDRFRVRVLSVDHNETIDDNQIDHRLKSLSKENNRNLRITGWKLDGTNSGSAYIDIVVPVQTLGEFKMPQVGDIVWVRLSNRGGTGNAESAIVEHATYDNAAADKGGNPVPLWGSQPGDYGVLLSHKYHNLQLSSKPKDHKIESAPKDGDVDFRSKWVASITGYRFRRFYKPTTKVGKFVLRSDPVFDIDKQNLNSNIVISDGVDYVKGQGIIEGKHLYPNPLNVPDKREEDKAMSFRYAKHRYLNVQAGNDPFKEGRQPVAEIEAEEFKLRNKNYTAFEPLMDKSYREKTKGFERELHAVDEWQSALKGNNKILMQDVHGDGEQLLMLFKNAVDAGLVVLQNGDVGQTRLRDNLGQTIFFEGDRDNPRIVIVTAQRQRLEMGHVKGKGNYMFMRNGEVWGDADTSWGTKTGKEQSSVFNQEVIFVDNEAVASDSEFKKLLSPGAASVVKGAGMFYRSSNDGEGKFEQTYSLYKKDGDLKESSKQTWLQNGSSVESYTEVNGSGNEVKFGLKALLKGKPLNTISGDNSKISLERFVKSSGARMGSVDLTDSGIDVDTEKAFTVNVGATSGLVNVGNPLSQVMIAGSTLTLMGHTIDLVKI